MERTHTSQVARVRSQPASHTCPSAGGREACDHYQIITDKVVCLNTNDHFHSTYKLYLDTSLSELPMWLSNKESDCQCRRRGFDAWVGKILWRRKWQPTPVFLPWKPHRQRSKKVEHNLEIKQQ